MTADGDNSEEPAKRTGLVVGAASVALFAIEAGIAALSAEKVLSDVVLLTAGLAVMAVILLATTAGVAVAEKTPFVEVLRRPFAASGTPRHGTAPWVRGWHVLGVEMVLLAGCCAPPYRSTWERRSVGIVCGALLALVGLAQGRDWKGIGTLAWPDPADGGREAAGTALLGAACVIAWAAGLVG